MAKAEDQPAPILLHNSSGELTPSAYQRRLLYTRNHSIGAVERIDSRPLSILKQTDYTRSNQAYGNFVKEDYLDKMIHRLKRM